jgi:hypothetical protein
MKYHFFLLLLITLMLTGCAPAHKITGSWVDREALPKTPYKSIFVLVISQNEDASYQVEEQMAQTLRSRGREAVMSYDIFPPDLKPMRDINREQLAAAITKAGCDAVITIALLDTKTEHRYSQMAGPYVPSGFGFYSNYNAYYNYYSPQVGSQGYYNPDKTYFVETNFYDLTSNQLLWSVQSEAYHPSNLNSFFKKYSGVLLNHLKSEKIISK